MEMAFTHTCNTVIYATHNVRACVVDLLGLGIIMCSIYYCITCMCKSHLHPVSFLFVPALYYTLKFKEYIFPFTCYSYSLQYYCNTVIVCLYMHQRQGLNCTPRVISHQVSHSMVVLCIWGLHSPHTLGKFSCYFQFQLLMTLQHRKCQNKIVYEIFH